MKKNLFLLAALLWAALGGLLHAPALAAGHTAGSLAPLNGALQIVPEQMTLSGDAVTWANSAGHCTHDWLAGMPAGSIILGVDPASCSPADWDGASASAALYLPASGPTIYTLEISWPDRDGKGLHSPQKNRKAVITWDGQPIWDMRTVSPGSYGDYYASEHVAILTSIVVTQSLTHTLGISVPAQTAWDISQVQLSLQPTPAAIRGIGYSPYRDCQYPGGAGEPSEAEIEEDLRRMFHTSNALRTYAAAGVNAQVVAQAMRWGLGVYPGAWLDMKPADPAEVAALIALAQTYPVDGLIIGNEFYLRNRSQAALDALLGYIQQVKAQVAPGLPLMSAEIDNLVFTWPSDAATTPTGINPAYRPIVDELDYVLIHIYPYWSGLPFEGAASFTVQRYLNMQALLEQEYPGQGKRLVIGETGWPSAGGSNGAAVPNAANAHAYYLEFLKLAAENDVEYFYFDAFDELWKIEEPGGVGQHRGYSYSDRSSKYPETGLFLPAAALAARLQALPEAAPAPSETPPADSPAAPVFTVFNEWPAGPERLAPPPATSPSVTPVFTVFNEWPAGPERLPPPLATAPSVTPVFTVFNEWPAGPGHFVPSGYMGDLEQVDVYECDMQQPLDGEMAVRASFTPGGALGWGGVYWQYPENNWGALPDGLDLSQANQLTFWARGAQGGERIRFVVGGLGAQADPYPESLRPAASSGFITLAANWQQYTIDLRGRDLSHVIGGFGWVTDECASPNGAVFYLDKIEFSYDPNPPAPSRLPSVLPVYTDAAEQDNHFSPSGFMEAAANPANIQLSECWYDNPHRGETSIRVQYTHRPAPGQYGGGVYWLDPAGNWGDRPGGLDLSGAARLTFWARSEVTTTLKIIVGGVGYKTWDGASLCNQPNGDYPDSLCPKIEIELTLTPNWQLYAINLQEHPGDYRRVVGGFGWYATHDVTFYLDDIQYECHQEIYLPLVRR